MDRQRGGNALWIGLVVAAAATVSCAALIGIGDRIPDEPDEAGAEASADTGAGCGSGEQCVLAPDGWSVVAFRKGTGDCAPGYGDKTDLAIATDACSCTCNETAKGSCGTGTVIVREFTGNDCTAGETTPYSYDGGDGGCTEQSSTFQSTFSTRFGNASIAFAPASCGDGGGVAKPEAPSTGRTCKPTSPRACESVGQTGTCAPAVTAAEALCVAKAGADEVCPAAFPVRIQGGTSAGADTRQCGTCTCASSPSSVCGTANVDLYAAKGCSGEKINVAVGFCTLLDGGVFTTNSYVFHYPQAPRCEPTSKTAVVGGSISFTDPLTVCCAPGTATAAATAATDGG